MGGAKTISMDKNARECIGFIYILLLYKWSPHRNNNIRSPFREMHVYTERSEIRVTKTAPGIIHQKCEYAVSTRPRRFGSFCMQVVYI